MRGNAPKVFRFSILADIKCAVVCNFEKRGW